VEVVMRDVAGLMHLAFKLVHEVSDACLAMEREPEMRAHRVHATLIADSGVSALAHVAAASAGLTDPSLAARLHVTDSLRGAREELRVLKQRLHVVQGLHYVPDHAAAEIAAKVDELSIVLMALTVEVRGNHMAA
jgi:hypothetical protein